MENHQFFDLDARLAKLGRRRHGENPHATTAFQATLDIGWIYHDNALEGVVLSYADIKDALAGKTQSVSSQGVMSEGIRDHKAAIDLVRKLGHAQAHRVERRGLINLALIKQLHAVLAPAEKSTGNPYRKDRPPHRAYRHEIAQADLIPQRMHKLCALLAEAPGSMHPLARAAGVHFEFMAIYPWSRNSGKVARLLMNLLLLRDGYPPALIPALERQRYYESLGAANDCLVALVTDTLNSYCDTATHFFDQLAGVPQQPSWITASPWAKSATR